MMRAAMEAHEQEALIAACLRYIRASELPTPLPTNATEYGSWREKASVAPEPDEDAEDAWFELDRLIDEEPENAWKIIIEIASRCRNEAECAQLAAGPLTAFMRDRRDKFASEIEEELIRNSGFRRAYAWLQ